MSEILKAVQNKVNHLVWTLISTGLIMLMLSILIAWDEIWFRLIVSLFVLVLSYSFLYMGIKLWFLKKDIEKHLKLK